MKYLGVSFMFMTLMALIRLLNKYNVGELPTHAIGDGMGFGFHRVCVITNV